MLFVGASQVRWVNFYLDCGATCMNSIDDIVKLPFTTKYDLRDNYPFGLCAVPMSQIVRIEASMSYDGKDVIVYIRDFGPGIPEDELPLVKKKFYKGSSSVRGTGIGLAVCDEIVEMHGGTLTLENAEGGGTLVTIRLPAEH